MKVYLCCLVFVTLCWAAAADSPRSPPKVQFYSVNPGEYGQSNTLVCHVSEFHPPDITIELLRNGEELPNAQQTDLAFKPDWHFHLMRSVAFNPQAGEKFVCKVTHGGKVTDYEWESNM